MLFKVIHFWQQTPIWTPCTEASARRQKETEAKRQKRKEHAELAAKVAKAREARKLEPKPGKLSQKARCDKPLSMIFFATSGNTPQGCPKECYCFRNQGYRSILFWNGSPMEVVILSPFCYVSPQLQPR